MTGIDTNLLVRYFIRDDEDQFFRVKSFLHRKLDEGETLFIADAVLCELVWVLSKGYRHAKGDVIRVLELVALSAGIVFQSPIGLRSAVAAFKTGQGDFADYLIRARALEAGCHEIATFDKVLLDESGFVEP